MKSMLAAVSAAILATSAWAADPKTTTTKDHQLGDVKGDVTPSESTKTGAQSQSTKSTAAESKDLTAMKDIASKLAKAFDANDAKAAAALFAEDAVLINPKGKMAQGREEIEQVINEDLQDFLKGGTTTFSDINVKMVKPDVAYFDMDHQVSGATVSEGEKAPQIHVSGLVVKRGGKWTILEARPATYLPETPTSPAS